MAFRLFAIYLRFWRYCSCPPCSCIFLMVAIRHHSFHFVVIVIAFLDALRITFVPRRLSSSPFRLQYRPSSVLCSLWASWLFLILLTLCILFIFITHAWLLLSKDLSHALSICYIFHNICHPCLYIFGSSDALHQQDIFIFAFIHFVTALHLSFSSH